MKPRVIIGVIALVGFTSLLMYNFGNSISTYTDFEKASDMESAHVVGFHVKSKPYGFSVKHKQFRFYMKDQSGNVLPVVYPKAKPNNFEQAERLVVIGNLRNGVFYADEMLMKCPSKYNDADPTQMKKASTSSKTS